MTPETWLYILLVSAMAGAAGQMARVVIGLKKLNDEASAKNMSVSDMIEPARMIVSLLIGAVAGVLTALSTVKPPAAGAALVFDSSAIIAFAVAGYTGADVIEGLMSGFMPRSGTAANTTTTNSTTTTTTGGGTTTTPGSTGTGTTTSATADGYLG